MHIWKKNQRTKTHFFSFLSKCTSLTLTFLVFLDKFIHSWCIWSSPHHLLLSFSLSLILFPQQKHLGLMSVFETFWKLQVIKIYDFFVKRLLTGRDTIFFFFFWEWPHWTFFNFKNFFYVEVLELPIDGRLLHFLSLLPKI